MYWMVSNCHINGSTMNSNFVGGLVGTNFWGGIANYGVSGTKINSEGKNVGGLSRWKP